MLVLSRHRNEQIVIGDDVIVTIVDIRGDKVRLGIEARKDVAVHRREVYEAIKRDEKANGAAQRAASAISAAAARLSDEQPAAAETAAEPTI